jgi:hypothetical protein
VNNELEGIWKEAMVVYFHIEGAVALCEFLAYLFELASLQDQTEYDLEEILTEFRSKQDHCLGNWYANSGFNGNTVLMQVIQLRKLF